jgi:hypothetical protein
VEYEEIEFKGDDEVKLSESDVLTLCTALEQNTKYSGPLKLPNHALTDQVTFQLYLPIYPFL